MWVWFTGQPKTQKIVKTWKSLCIITKKTKSTQACSGLQIRIAVRIRCVFADCIVIVRSRRWRWRWRWRRQVSSCTTLAPTLTLAITTATFKATPRLGVLTFLIFDTARRLGSHHRTFGGKREERRRRRRRSKRRWRRHRQRRRRISHRIVNASRRRGASGISISGRNRQRRQVCAAVLASVVAVVGR